ncbi:MAG TPA: PEGA domain-containing protein [Kofleriaceae bacterium]|nr:PEGA domain-containing protein [Kofleriaceae bacterium]
MKRLALVLLVACGGTQAPRGHGANDAIMYLTSNVADAQVYVDGKFVGPINLVKAGIAGDPGKHRVELRHDDYFSRYAELDLQRAEKKKLDLDLAPVLP